MSNDSLNISLKELRSIKTDIESNIVLIPEISVFPFAKDILALITIEDKVYKSGSEEVE